VGEDRILLVKPGILLDEKFMFRLSWAWLKYETFGDSILPHRISTLIAHFYTMLHSGTLKPALSDGEPFTDSIIMISAVPG